MCDTQWIHCGVAQEFRLNEHSYIVLGTTAGPKVYLNSCPHLGVPLNWLPDQFLDQELELIKCATHGALFKPEDGLCIQGPCAGDKLTAVEFIIKDDGIFIV